MELAQYNKFSTHLSVFIILVLNCLQRSSFLSLYPLASDFLHVWPWNPFAFYDLLMYIGPDIQNHLLYVLLLPSSAVINIVPPGRLPLVIRTAHPI